MSTLPGLKVCPEDGGVALDRPVTLVHSTAEAERLIVKCARVSNQANEDNWETGPKLLRYLVEHKHWSPFELAFMCVRIETTLDVAAQICRHRSFAFQQFSCRYAKTAKAEAPHFRRQDTKNRQNSFDDLSAEEQACAQEVAERCIDLAYDTYEKLLEAGIAKESARRVLPVCTPTTVYMAGSLRSFLHYIQVRAHPDTQAEHREIAEEIKKIFCAKFPIIAEALGWDL
jgi:thymidylate synthase (FAD)